MPPVSTRISLLTDLFLAAAHADDEFCEKETSYVRNVLEDLLCTEALPESVEHHIRDFDPAAFNLVNCATDFLSEPPMSKRRLLELVTYVTMADGEVSDSESAFIVDLAAALKMAHDDYQDLVPEQDVERIRESFADLARIPLPEA